MIYMMLTAGSEKNLEMFPSSVTKEESIDILLYHKCYHYYNLTLINSKLNKTRLFNV